MNRWLPVSVVCARLGGPGVLAEEAPAKIVGDLLWARGNSETTSFSIGDGSGSHFTGGPWSESDGVISPPDLRNLHSRAFLAPQSFSDLTAVFEFNGCYRETGALRAMRGGKAASWSRCCRQEAARQTRGGKP